MTSFSALSFSYIFAGAAGRHPYLVYSALSVPAVAALQYLKALPIVDRLLALVATSPSASILPPTDAAIVEAEETDEKSTPVTRDGSPALSAASEEEVAEETSALDNSVYRHVTKSDYEEDSEADEQLSKSVHTKLDSAAVAPKEKQQVAAAAANAEIGVSSEVPALVKELCRIGNVAGTVSGLAFLMVTVGIFGDLAN